MLSAIPSETERGEQHSDIERAVSVDEMRMKNFCCAVFVCEGHPPWGRIILIKCLSYGKARIKTFSNSTSLSAYNVLAREENIIGREKGATAIVFYMSSPVGKSASTAPRRFFPSCSRTGGASRHIALPYCQTYVLLYL